jgi:Flp pilus assembly protein CpaB
MTRQRRLAVIALLALAGGLAAVLAGRLLLAPPEESARGPAGPRLAAGAVPVIDVADLQISRLD